MVAVVDQAAAGLVDPIPGGDGVALRRSGRAIGCIPGHCVSRRAAVRSVRCSRCRQRPHLFDLGLLFEGVVAEDVGVVDVVAVHEEGRVHVEFTAGEQERCGGTEETGCLAPGLFRELVPGLFRELFPGMLPGMFPGMLPGKVSGDQHVAPHIQIRADRAGGHEEQEGSVRGVVVALRVEGHARVVEDQQEYREECRRTEKLARGGGRFFYVREEGGGQEEEREAADEGEAVVVAAYFFQKREKEVEGLPGEGQGDEDQEGGAEDFFAEGAGVGGEVAAAADDREAAAEERRDAVLVRVADHIAGDRGERARAEEVEEELQVQGTFAGAHVQDGGQEEDAAEEHAEQHVERTAQYRHEQVAHGEEAPFEGAGAQGCLIEGPEGGEHAGHARAVPAEEDHEAGGDAEQEAAAAADRPPGAEEHEREHVDGVQPHDVAALEQIVLHECIAEGEQHGEQRAGAVREARLHIVRESARREHHLQHDEEVEEGGHLLLPEEHEEQVEGRGQVVGVVAGHADAELGREGIGEGGPAVQDVLQVLEQVHVLDLRVHAGEGQVVERGIPEAPEEQEHDQAGQGSRKEAEAQAPADGRPLFAGCCIIRIHASIIYEIGEKVQMICTFAGVRACTE